MAGIEAYVDLIPEFANLAGLIQKGVEKATKKVDASVSITADTSALTKDVAKASDTAASKAASEVDFSPAFGSMTKDVAKEADQAAGKAASDVKFSPTTSFNAVVKDASSAAGKAASDVKFGADTGGLAGDVKSAAKKAEGSASIEIPVEADTSGAGSKLGKLGDKGKEIGGSFSEEFSGKAMDGIGAGALVGKAGWIGIAVTAAGIFADGFTGALEQQKASKQAQASMGLTPAEAKKFSKTAGDIYKNNWGDSIEDVNDAIAQVKGGIKGLGSQKDLQKATEQALAYSQIFGVEVGPAATSAGTLIKSGLAKDSTEAFDLMTKSAQTAGPQMTEPILDAVNEYSKHFQSLGIDGPAAMGILTKSAENGEIGIDKAGDAIKEFGIRATDLGDTGAQDALKDMGLNGKQLGTDLLKGGDDGAKAFDTIIGGLRDIKDPAKQAQAATALFGTPLEDMGKDQIPAFLSSLDSGKDSMDNFAGSAKKAGDVVSTGPGATIETFKRKVKQNLVDFIGGQVLPSLEKFGGFLSKNVPSAWDTMTNALSQNKDLMSVVDSLGSIGRSIGSFFQQLGGVLSSIWTVIGPTVKKAFGNILDTVKGVFTGIFHSAAGALELIAGLFSGDPKKMKEGASKFFGGIKDAILAVFRGVINGVRIILDPIAGFIGKKLGQAKDAAVKKVTDLKNGVVNKFTSMKDAAGKKVTDLKDGAVKRLGQLKDGAVRNATTLKNGVVGKFTALKDQAGKNATTLKNGVVRTFGFLKDGAVKNVQTLKNGAVSRLSSLKDWGTGKFKSGWSKMKGVLSDPLGSAKSAIGGMFGEGGTVRRIFNGFLTATKSIFGKLKGIVGKPINAMITAVNHGLIRDGINFLLGKVGVDKKNQLPWIPMMKLRDGGRVHGPGGERSDKVPIMGSPNEFMVKAKSAKNVGYDTLEHINETGEIPVRHLKDGGKVNPMADGGLVTVNGGRFTEKFAGIVRQLMKSVPGFQMYQGGWNAGGVAASGGTHDKDAIDYGPATRQSETIGRSLGLAAWLRNAATGWTQTGPHVHAVGSPANSDGSSGARAQWQNYLDGENGLTGHGRDTGTRKYVGKGGLGAAVGNIFASIKDKAGKLIGDPMKWISGKIGKLASIGESPLAQGLMKIPGYLLGQAKNWLTSKVSGNDGASATWNGAGVGSLGKDQLNNAATIISTARSLGFGDRGATIGLMTALQESTLRNLSGGDRDSVGLFQQRAPWGSFADRTNPAKSAAMFFNGGQGGQPGLRSKNWKSGSMAAAAQAVQVSAFPGAYAKWEGLASQLVGKYATGGTTPRSGTILAGENGPELISTPGGSTVSNKRQTAELLGREKVTEFRITDWEKGVGFFRTIARDEADQAEEFSGTMNRMRGR